MQVGETIRVLRNLKKMTHKEVAFHLEITPQAYSKIERDECGITLERLCQIAKVLEADACEILLYHTRKDTAVPGHSGGVTVRQASGTPPVPCRPEAEKPGICNRNNAETLELWKIIEYQKREMEVLRNEKTELLKIILRRED